MTVLFDVGHPAHVHLFKHIGWILQDKGINVLFTCRERDNVVLLLENFGFDYKCFGKAKTSFVGKLFLLFCVTYKLLRTGLKYKPKVMISNGSMYAAIASYILRIPHIAHEDTGNMEQIMFYLPFTRFVLSPESLHMSFGKKHHTYRGFQESFYLHPSRFQADRSILNRYNLNEGEDFIVLRFVSYNASHDIGYRTLDQGMKIELTKELSKNFTVFITHEGGLPSYLSALARAFRPEDAHHLMAFSKAYIGQSATMASEAAHLKVPSFFLKSKNEKTEGVIDFAHSKGFYQVIEYGENQVQAVLTAIDNWNIQKHEDIHDYIVDPNEVLYNAVRDLITKATK